MARYTITQLVIEICEIARAIENRESQTMSEAEEEILNIARHISSSSNVDDAAVKELLEAQGIPANAWIDYVSTLTDIQAENDPFKGVPDTIYNPGQTID